MLENNETTVKTKKLYLKLPRAQLARLFCAGVYMNESHVAGARGKYSKFKGSMLVKHAC